MLNLEPSQGEPRRGGLASKEASRYGRKRDAQLMVILQSRAEHRSDYWDVESVQRRATSNEVVSQSATSITIHSQQSTLQVVYRLLWPIMTGSVIALFIGQKRWSLQRVSTGFGRRGGRRRMNGLTLKRFRYLVEEGLLDWRYRFLSAHIASQ